MKIRQLTAEDVKTIRDWPAYPSEFSALDYALREHGWLDDFPEGPTNHRYGAWENAELVGFSILTEIRSRRAEFYIAVHPDKLGQGLGKVLTQLVLAKGFQELGLDTIYLKVRAWHARGIRVYEKAGFHKVGCGEFQSARP